MFYLADAPRDYSKKIEYYNYTWQMFVGGCRFWNEENETWSSEGCTVSFIKMIVICTGGIHMFHIYLKHSHSILFKVKWDNALNVPI